MTPLLDAVRPSTPEKKPPMASPAPTPARPLLALSTLSLYHVGEEGSSGDVRHARPYSPRNSLDAIAPLSRSPERMPGHSSPRNQSPYNRTHARSASTNTPYSAPAMVRAHSSPTRMTPSILPPYARSTSPLRSPGRVRSPFRIPTEDEPSLVASPSAMYDIEVISEDSELDLAPRAITENPAQMYLLPSPVASPNLTVNSGNAFSSSRRRRPASPLYQVTHASFPGVNTHFPVSAGSSPLFLPKFNEAFPTELPLRHSRSFSSSSVPSTPTSARSRSPSISSLETIADAPDAETAAVEAERADRQRAALEGGTSGAVPRRSSLDIPGQRGGVGFGFTSRDKRKRWSVCGAERRGDLDLETIWED